MGKRLLVLRHGEAEPAGSEEPDRVRPLSSRGRRDAAAVAGWLAREGIHPDVALCSTALRARETLRPIAELAEAAGASAARGSAAAMGRPGLAIRFDDSLYLASRETLVAALRSVDARADVVLLVGHNPGLAELVAWLDPDVRVRGPIAMAPAALARFAVRVDDWRDLVPGAAELLALTGPEGLVP